jgi:hypothetical protein
MQASEVNLDLLEAITTEGKEIYDLGFTAPLLRLLLLKCTSSKREKSFKNKRKRNEHRISQSERARAKTGVRVLRSSFLSWFQN